MFRSDGVLEKVPVKGAGEIRVEGGGDDEDIIINGRRYVFDVGEERLGELWKGTRRTVPGTEGKAHWRATRLRISAPSMAWPVSGGCRTGTPRSDTCRDRSPAAGAAAAAGRTGRSGIHRGGRGPPGTCYCSPGLHTKKIQVRIFPEKNI